uniref:Protocadherin-15 (inferred by orthology to a human protein) n=1 Tax=Nippostrongylus brasiliensis TaxID=27835 RepID=A0A158R3A5_NIPBR
LKVTNGAEGQFRYDNSSNILYVTGDLTPGERYQVVIEATDGGGKSSKAIVVVLATHAQFGLASLAPLPGMETFVPNPMAFTMAPNQAAASAEEEETIQTFVTEVAENTPVNTVVVSLGGDGGNDVYFSIAGGNNEEKFQINEQTGTITTIGEFDRERTAMYSLQIDTRSRHPDQHLYWTLVQISVLDVNDNSPHFVGAQPIRLRLSVDDLDQLTANMVIGKVTVEDPDSDDNGRLELRVAPDMNRLFSVTNDGVVSINGDFTAAHFGEHRIFIIARDHGDPPREAKAEVIVSIFGTLITVATEPPTSETFEYTNSAEEEPETQPDYYFQSITSSPTRGNAHTFSAFPSPSPAPPSPTLPTAMVTPDYSTPYQPPPTTTAPQALRLAPVFNPATITVTADENESGKEIARVHASYPDGNSGTISYVLHKGDPTLFAVSSYSGSVSLLRPLDAETDTSYVLQVSTAEAAGLAVDPTMAHFVSITVHVGDVNDWIPNFESSSYSFVVQEDTMPGTIIGQVTAFDQDREPNNRIRYRLVSAGGLENYFAVNPDTGLITLALQVDAFAGEKITLRIEASDSGVPSQSSMTSVLIDIVATASQVLSVNNKPADTRFVSCNIISGNYRGAFSITAGSDGNCELRTQMELDRESVERYLLNVTVTAGSETDFALVSITVLDVNDNVPRFIYDNDLGLTTYFAGVSSTAGAFTRVLTVKAEDADLGNSSVVNYSLDPLSMHSKYFTVSPTGEISTKQSMTQLLQKSRISSFEIRVTACDSPIAGQQLCSKADIVINVITEAHRFRMITTGLNPQQLRAHEKDYQEMVVLVLVGLAVLIAIGAVVGICTVCVFWSRYKTSQHSVHSFNPHGYPQKLGTVYLPNPPHDPRFDKIYETQMLEMPISDEDTTMKSSTLGGGRVNIGYGNYGRQGSSFCAFSIAYEGDFSIEENMYALNVPGRMDPVTKYVEKN